MESCDVLIIGAGHGGVSVAAELRRLGYPGSITLVNAEGAAPYHRPPLSKAWLKGDADADTGWLQPPGYFDQNGIRLLSTTRVTELDAEGRVAHLDDGRVLGFAFAVLATGALARPLPGQTDGQLPLLSLRDAADAAALKELLAPGSRLAIVGAGFVGLEVAATARHLGVEVCVIERESRVLARLASVELSAQLARHHAAHGVEILVDADVMALRSNPQGGIDVTIGSSAPRGFDSVLVAIGAVPDETLARTAGLECGNGVLVDDRGRTSAPHLFAVGDVARRPLQPYADSARLESVHNANEHARIVAATIAGAASPAPATPWFWSDQFDWKLQIAGLLPDDADTEVRGDLASGSFALLHRVDGRLRCVEAVNSSREFALGRRQIASDAEPADQLISAS